MPHVLFLDANWDVVTEYLFSFRSHFISNHITGRHTVHELKAADVVQPTVDRYLRGKNIAYISGAGHGVYEAFKGYKDAIIWAEGITLPPLNGVIVHLLSCQAARQLGQAMIAAGVQAFWGYQENFRFVRKKFPPADRYTDTSAKWAIYMDCLIDIGILQGKPPDEIYNDVHQHVIQETSNLGPYDFKRAILNHNFRHLVCPSVYWGDRNGRI